MKQYPFLTRRTSQAAFGLMLCALLFLCRDTLFCHLIMGFELAQVITLGLVGLTVVLFLGVNRKELQSIIFDRRVLWLIVCAAVVLLPMAIKRDWQLMYFSVFLGICIAVFFTYFLTWQQAATYYVVVLTILAAFSVVATYLLRIPADVGILVPPILTGEYDVTYYNYGLSFVSIWYVKNRNFGIFREPGVYQFFLLLGIYLTNYGACWKKASHQVAANVILVIAMLSTFATGGVIAMGLLAVVMFVDRKWYRDKRICIAAAAAVAVGICGVIAIIIQHGALYETLVDMFGKLFSGDGESMGDRVGSIVLNMRLFASSPVWGVKLREPLYGIANNTSSSTILFAILGILGGLLNMASWFALVWQKERAVWINLALVVILAMAFNTENLIADPFFWMIPFMALTQRLLPLLDTGLSLRRGEDHG